MRRNLVVLVLAVLVSQLHAQQPSRATIDSKVLSETRSVLIRAPGSYAIGARSYPVIYLTDGDRQLVHTAATVDFLTREGRMPEVILVGITNTDRTRDLTPTHLDRTTLDGQEFRFATSGGADKFLSFIETELIPYVEANYRTQPFRVFAGHSFGGLFAMHALLSRPRLFNGIIAVSPTFTWDNNYINRRVPQFLKNNRELNGTLVVTVGDEGEPLDREMARFRSLMQSNAPKGFEWQATRFDDEDHGSVVLPSHYAGLRKIFAPWRFPINPTDDATQLMSRAREHYAKLSQRVGYTIQIPEPTTNLIGYRLLQTGQLPQAIEVFNANVEAYPNSANVFDSLGEAYERSGSLDLALVNYERAASLGKENADPNTNIYEQNRDRAAKALNQRSNVTRLGGTFEIDEKAPGKPIVKIDLHETAITDADLAFLSDLQELRELDLRVTQITDAGVEHLRDLKNLEFLNLFRTNLTDAGLVHLRNMSELRTLLIGRTNVTDAGLTNLLPFRKLRKLSLFRNEVTDAALPNLRQLESLEVLLIGGSKISESGAAELQRAIPGLRFNEQT